MPEQEARQQTAGGVGAEVAGRPGRVRRAGLPVGHPAGALRHGADVGLGALAQPVGVGGADRDLPLLAAVGRPVDVDAGGTVGGVEEAGWSAGRQRQALTSGADAGDGVAAVLQRCGDVADLVGVLEQLERAGGRLVGVQGPLPVLQHRLVGGAHGDVTVEALQLLAEAGHVLLGGAPRGVEVGGPDRPGRPGRPRAEARRRRERDGRDQRAATTRTTSRSSMLRRYPAPGERVTRG